MYTKQRCCSDILLSCLLRGVNAYTLLGQGQRAGGASGAGDGPGDSYTANTGDDCPTLPYMEKYKRKVLDTLQTTAVNHRWPKDMPRGYHPQTYIDPQLTPDAMIAKACEKVC